MYLEDFYEVDPTELRPELQRPKPLETIGNTMFFLRQPRLG